MGIEGFIPGLAQMMEERFGSFGRPLTTTLMLVVAIGIMVWFGSIIWEKALRPITLSLSQLEGFAEVVGEIPLFLLGLLVFLIVGVVLAVIAAAFSAVFTRFGLNRLHRRQNQLAAEDIGRAAERLLDLPSIQDDKREQISAAADRVRRIL